MTKGQKLRHISHQSELECHFSGKFALLKQHVVQKRRKDIFWSWTGRRNYVIFTLLFLSFLSFIRRLQFFLKKLEILSLFWNQNGLAYNLTY